MVFRLGLRFTDPLLIGRRGFLASVTRCLIQFECAALNGHRPASRI